MFLFELSDDQLSSTYDLFLELHVVTSHPDRRFWGSGVAQTVGQVQ